MLLIWLERNSMIVSWWCLIWLRRNSMSLYVRPHGGASVGRDVIS